MVRYLDVYRAPIADDQGVRCMKRILAMLLLAMMLVPMCAIASASPAAYASSDDSTRPLALHDSNGASYHLATAADVHALKETWGVREPGKDYNVIYNGFGTGAAPPTEDSYAKMVGKVLIQDSAPAGPMAIPSAYDLSKQPYFPAVGNQGGQGSCAAWAATYYTYGYLEAKDNGWADAKTGATAHLMSPAWTYNKVNGGSDLGSWMTDCFAITTDWGTATLATLGYRDSDPLAWGKQAAWREAPLHKGLSIVELDYSGDATIDQLKALIAAEQPVTFTLHADGFDFIGNDHILNASEYNVHSMNHAQTIVGYNDSISGGSDVGAFRVVNSWGTGFEDNGYYWITYKAFKRIAALNSNLGLSYVTDRIDYSPSLLAVWHFNSAPTRDAMPEVGIGPPQAPVDWLKPYLASDSSTSHRQETFMCLDITGLRDHYDAGTNSFYLRHDSAKTAGTISDFKVEIYASGYVAGQPTQASGQASNLPVSTVNTATLSFPYYAPIAANEAMETNLTYSSTTLSLWVPVNHHSWFGGDALQSGDTADSSSSVVQTTVSGPGTATFYWKVSSESGKDVLRASVDGSIKLNISGEVDWQIATLTLTSGAHTLRWEYIKDATNSVGSDAGWIDRLRILPQDDAYEPNNDAQHAKSLGAGSYDLVGNNDDWFKVGLGTGARLYANITLINANGNLDLFLYDTDASTLLRSSATANDLESVQLDGAGQAGEYYLLIKGHDGDTNIYTLTIEIKQNDFDYGSVSSITILSGTGAFSSLSPGSKVIIVTAGNAISGSVTLSCNNQWADGLAVPVIGAPSWGAHSSSYSVPSGGLATGTTILSAPISLTAPATGGQYYLIFAFRNESAAAQVASATRSPASPVWNDGNDIASFSSLQVLSAQSSGRAAGQWLIGGVNKAVPIPADAIVINVQVPDSTPPQTSAHASGTPGNAGWYRSSVSVAFTATDSGGSGVRSTYFNLDGSGWMPYGSPVAVNEEGNHTLLYYSKDNAGNTEATRSMTLRIDLTAPSSDYSIEGTQGQDGWYVSSTSITLSASDATSGLVGIFYRVDGSGWSEFSDILLLTEEGTHLVERYAQDVAGTNESVKSFTAKIDRSAPHAVALLNGTSSGSWFNSSVEVNLTAEDDLSGPLGIQYRLDGGPWTECQGEVTVVPEGEHVLEYYAVDRAGLISEVQNLTFGIDRTEPQLQVLVTGNQSEGWFTEEAWIELNASDNDSGLESLTCAVNGSSPIQYDGPFSLGDGTYQLSFQARDLAGNVVNQAMQVKVDLLAPQTSMAVDGQAGQLGWFLSEVNVTITASDSASGVASVHYRLDHGDWSTNASFPVLTEGNHTLEYYSVDRAGNREPMRNSTISLDMSAPFLLDFLEGERGMGSWYSHNLTASFECNDQTSGVAGIYYRLDQGQWTLFSSVLLLGAEGPHSLAYYVVDRAGNRAEVQLRNFSIDDSAPSIEMFHGSQVGQNGWYTSAVIVGFNASDELSGVYWVQYSLDDGPWMTGNSTSVAEDGVHDLKYKAMDRAGIESAVGSFSFKIDGTSPQLSLPSSAGSFTVDSVVINWQDLDNVSGVALVEYSLDGGSLRTVMPQSGSRIALSELADGDHRLLVRVTDKAGNSAAKTVTFHVDTNLLSPDGPSGPWLLIGMVVAVLGAVSLVALFLRRRPK